MIEDEDRQEEDIDPAEEALHRAACREDHLQRKLDAEVAENAKLRALLKTLEWQGHYAGGAVCPWCGGLPSGHRTDGSLFGRHSASCELAAALKEDQNVR